MENLKYSKEEAINDGLLHNITGLTNRFKCRVVISNYLWKNLIKDLNTKNSILPLISLDIKELLTLRTTIEDGAKQLARLDNFLRIMHKEVLLTVEENNTTNKCYFNYNNCLCYVVAEVDDFYVPVLTIYLNDE